MGTKDEIKEQGDVVDKIYQDQILLKLLNDRFNCSQCSEFQRRGSRLVTRCREHVEQLKAELASSPKKPEK
jgi:hypothetical protein